MDFSLSIDMRYSHTCLCPVAGFKRMFVLISRSFLIQASLVTPLDFSLRPLLRTFAALLMSRTIVTRLLSLLLRFRISWLPHHDLFTWFPGIFLSSRLIEGFLSYNLRQLYGMAVRSFPLISARSTGSPAQYQIVHHYSLFPVSAKIP